MDSFYLLDSTKLFNVGEHSKLYYVRHLRKSAGLTS